LIKEAPHEPMADKRAIAEIQSRSDSTLTGTATFVEREGKVTLIVQVKGGKPGPHGIHLHENGDCGAPDASSAGAHWNPTGVNHGKMDDTPQAHSGDLGNLTIGEDGTGKLEFTTDRWSINGDPNTNILGKSIVIHNDPDDLKTQPSGNSGARIGCGVIEMPKTGL
ncbi:MAG TPA: superoxide dismutase family protein, partial [Fimbriimonadaceae bacterium]|nr:superoxide dismutase family protein [Fimbriimonadaceae bacterium]